MSKHVNGHREMNMDTLDRSVDQWANKMVANEWRRYMPDYLGYMYPGASFGTPECDVERRMSPNYMQTLNIKLTISDVSGPHQEFEVFITERELMNYRTGRIDVVGVLREKLNELMRMWTTFLLREIGGVPEGVLPVWDDEIMPRESGKARNLLKGEGQVRKKLGVMLMEEEDGSVSVQLYNDPNDLKESFNSLTGKPGDKPQRATMLSLDYSGDVVEAAEKNLPVIPDKSNVPDMHVLGKGPTNFKEGWEAEVDVAFKGVKR
jgi:hypothetical protein